MERKNILTSQKEVVKNSWESRFNNSWGSRFNNSGVDVVKYLGAISAEIYCAFIGLDYSTVKRLGNVTYSISYLREVKEEEELFLLLCETYIDSVMNDKLSVILEDSEDWLGMFSTKQNEEGLPSNWKELITDEQLHDILRERNIQTIECLIDDDVPDEMKERIARDWCSNNSEELRDYLSSEDERDIAYNYAHDNPSDMGDEVCDYLGSSDSRDLIIKLLDNL